MSFQDMDFRSPWASLDVRRGDASSGLRHAISLPGAAGTRRLAAWGIVGALLVFALTHVLVRGPVNAWGNVNLCDFANHYSAARLWLIGSDPYDNATLPIVWKASWPGPFAPPLEDWWSLLPPGALVVLAPLGALPAWAATILWLTLSAGAIAASLVAVMFFAKIRPASPTGWLLVAGALAAAPFQTLLAVGQVSLFAIALILVAIALAQRGRDVWAGILLGIAACLKPQLAAPFGLFYLIYRNWKLAGFAAVTGLTLNLLGIAQLEWRGVAWWSSWTAGIAASTQPGQANDATLTGPWRHQIVSLNVLLYAFFGAQSMVMALNILIGGVIIGSYAWLARRARLSADSLLSLSVLCVLSLLPVYHRSYDAALLLVPFAWALTALRSPLRRAAWATLAALAVFLIPFDALVLAEQKLGLFAGVSRSWLWQALVAPHHAWAALTVCTCLIGALYARVRQLSAGHDNTYQPDIIHLQAYQRATDTADRWRAAAAGAEPRPARRTG